MVQPTDKQTNPKCRRMGVVDVAIALMASLASATQSTEHCLQLFVPAYGNPCCGDGIIMWRTLIDTAANNKAVTINVILDPDSGPGQGDRIDPNYLNDNDSIADPILDLFHAGGIICGYVATTFGRRPISQVTADIDKYYNSSYWYDGPVLLNGGIFLDEMSNDLDATGYYQEIRDYIYSKDEQSKVIANPGTAATYSSSGSNFTIQDYANAANVLVTFEQSADTYWNNYIAPDWLDPNTTFDRDRFAHLVHGTNDTPTMLVELACQRHAGMIYFTDDTLVPNPWDSLTSYWSELVTVVVETAGNCCTRTTTTSTTRQPTAAPSSGVSKLGALWLLDSVLFGSFVENYS